MRPVLFVVNFLTLVINAWLVGLWSYQWMAAGPVTNAVWMYAVLMAIVLCGFGIANLRFVSRDWNKQ